MLKSVIFVKDLRNKYLYFVYGIIIECKCLFFEFFVGIVDFNMYDWIKGGIKRCCRYSY